MATSIDDATLREKAYAEIPVELAKLALQTKYPSGTAKHDIGARKERYRHDGVVGDHTELAIREIMDDLVKLSKTLNDRGGA